ncbi:MAG: hypothetical protein RL499_239 [Actinomycetota bacterium]|jgi:hypothetical protein
MTDPAVSSTPAGWYPDPAGSAQRRWWDGTQWTDTLETPYSAGAAVQALRAPDGTDPNTPWIWLIVFLPMVSSLGLLFIDWSDYVEGLLTDPTGLSAYSFLLSPAYLVSLVLGWIVTGLLIWFAYLDWRELKQRGVPEPFHWAWIFLMFVVSYGIYTIGRAVVANRRTGKGLSVMWATIATFVVSFIIAIVVTIVMTVQIFEAVSSMTFAP